MHLSVRMRRVYMRVLNQGCNAMLTDQLRLRYARPSVAATAGDQF